MPRRREKTRTDWLALAIEKHVQAGEAIAHIDLRSTKDPLKATLKRIRAQHDALAKELALAVREDLPPAPLVR
jgi:hypothetical protein